MSEGIVRLKSATVAIAAVTALLSTLAIFSGALDEAAISFGFIAARFGGQLGYIPAAPR